MFVSAPAKGIATDNESLASRPLAPRANPRSPLGPTCATIDDRSLAGGVAKGEGGGHDSTARLGSSAAASGTGLMAQYFAQPDQTDLAETTIDALIDYEWTLAGPTTTTRFPQQANYAVVWSGYIEAPVCGTYTIYATTDDGMRVTIGGLPVSTSSSTRVRPNTARPSFSRPASDMRSRSSISSMAATPGPPSNGNRPACRASRFHRVVSTRSSEGAPPAHPAGSGSRWGGRQAVFHEGLGARSEAPFAMDDDGELAAGPWQRRVHLDE